MTGALKKSMMWLGLAPEDDEYGDESYEQEAGRRTTGRSDTGDAPSGSATPRSAEVTPIKRERSVPTLVREPATTTGEIARIATIHPRSYNDAKAIGESFRAGIPVIMNLSDMGESDAKRLVDFSAGLVFGLHGSIERVTSKVFLLSPKNVEVTEEGAGAATGTTAGFFNQS